MVVGDAANGWPAEKLFGPNASYGLTFDDVAFLPALEAAPAARTAKLSARFSRNISLKLPFVAGPGPTVCEDRMAVQLALMGGIGIIHHEQSVEEQVAMVRRVKEHETAFILVPRVLGPRATLGDARRAMEEVGCSGLPITENGRIGGKLIGLITRRDLDALKESGAGAHQDDVVTKVMVYDVVTVSEPITYREAQAVMRQRKVGKLPVINSERELVALICRGDQTRADKHPNATRDPNSQLMVAASITMDEHKVADGLGFERAIAVVEAGVDALLVVVDEGVSGATVDFVKRLKATMHTTDVVCGRVSSLRMAEALCKADCDGLLVGAPASPAFAAPGMSFAGGAADASVLFQVARLARMNYGLPVCAEGGVRSAGDVVKAFCLGASTVAPRALLARTEESPGEHLYLNGLRAKLRPVTGRRGAAAWPAAPAVCSQAIDCGSIQELLPHLIDRLKGGWEALGLKGFPDVHPSLASGTLRFEVLRPLLPPPRCAPPSSATSEAEPAPERQRLTSSALFARW